MSAQLKELDRKKLSSMTNEGLDIEDEGEEEDGDDFPASVCGITTADAEAGFFIGTVEGAPSVKTGTCGFTTAGVDFPGLLLAAAS